MLKSVWYAITAAKQRPALGLPAIDVQVVTLRKIEPHCSLILLVLARQGTMIMAVLSNALRVGIVVKLAVLLQFVLVVTQTISEV